jgi:hypothetical protein
MNKYEIVELFPDLPFWDQMYVQFNNGLYMIRYTIPVFIILLILGMIFKNLIVKVIDSEVFEYSIKFLNGDIKYLKEKFKWKKGGKK